MRIDIVTSLPGLVEGPLQHSILHRGQQKGLVEIYVHDLRKFATGKHRRVDDYPFGGGAGMVLKPEPIFECIESLQKARAQEGEKYDEIIYLSPDGEVLNQPMANKLSMYKNILLLAGHYKGIDQRVRDTLITKEISVGDYVLSGGELPALVLVDALVRIIPGVIGDAVSALSDAFQEDRLDAPAYTRPAEYRDMKVPDVLLSGNHKKIEAWREDEKLRKTRQLRPDLLSSDDDIDR